MSSSRVALSRRVFVTSTVARSTLGTDNFLVEPKHLLDWIRYRKSTPIVPSCSLCNAVRYLTVEGKKAGFSYYRNVCVLPGNGGGRWFYVVATPELIPGYTEIYQTRKDSQLLMVCGIEDMPGGGAY